MLAALCLAFLPAVTPIETKTPRDIERRAFEGVKAQYEKRFPGRHLSFGSVAECPNLGQYEFIAEGLKLTAAHELWNEERFFSFEDLLEGKRLEFPSDSPVRPGGPDFLLAASQTSTVGGPMRTSSRILLSALAGAASSAALAVAMSPNDESRGMNGLVFGLSGALGGALLSVLWSEL